MSVISKKSIQKDIKVLKNKNSNSTIVFLPMIHIGKKDYYTSIEKVIDSLRKEEYSIYYESIAMSKDIDTLIQKKYYKKFRKFIGFHITLDKDNKSLPSYTNKKNYIYQDYSLMGLKRYDKVLDVPINELIDIYEKKYGLIKLTECDIETPLNKQYKCKTEYKNKSFTITNVLRDSYITDSVLNLKTKKNVLIYGKQHWYFIYPELIKNGYELVKGKI